MLTYKPVIVVKFQFERFQLLNTMKTLLVVEILHEKPKINQH